MLKKPQEITISQPIPAKSPEIPAQMSASVPEIVENNPPIQPIAEQNLVKPGESQYSLQQLLEKGQQNAPIVSVPTTNSPAPAPVSSPNSYLIVGNDNNASCIIC